MVSDYFTFDYHNFWATRGKLQALKNKLPFTGFHELLVEYFES